MPKKTYRIEEPTLNWPVDSHGELRFEILSGEWGDTGGERSPLCNHWLELEQIHHAIDLLSEASSLLEVAARSLFRGET